MVVTQLRSTAAAAQDTTSGTSERTNPHRLPHVRHPPTLQVPCSASNPAQRQPTTSQVSSSSLNVPLAHPASSAISWQDAASATLVKTPPQVFLPQVSSATIARHAAPFGTSATRVQELPSSSPQPPSANASAAAISSATGRRRRARQISPPAAEALIQWCRVSLRIVPIVCISTLPLWLPRCDARPSALRPPP